MLDQNKWAEAVIEMTEHKLIEKLEEKNKEESWTSSEVECIKNATKALYFIHCMTKCEEKK